MTTSNAKTKTAEKRLYSQNLIEFVRSRPILYDPGSEEYKNIQKKTLVWQQFGDEQFPAQDGKYLFFYVGSDFNQCIYLTGKIVKTNWNTLRTAYSRAKKQLASKLPSGSGSKALKIWEHFESMQFLDGVLEPCEDPISVPVSQVVNSESAKTAAVPPAKISVYDETSKSFTDEFFADVEVNDQVFMRDDSANSFPGGSLYLESTSPSMDSLAPQVCKDCCTLLPKAQTSSSKKRKADALKDESDMFFKNFGKVLKELAPEPKSDPLLQEFLDMMHNDTAVYLKSLQPSLEYFKKDPIAFEIVKHRIQGVIIDSMKEFPQKKD